MHWEELAAAPPGCRATLARALPMDFR